MPHRNQFYFLCQTCGHLAFRCAKPSAEAFRSAPLPANSRFQIFRRRFLRSCAPLWWKTLLCASRSIRLARCSIRRSFRSAKQLRRPRWRTCLRPSALLPAGPTHRRRSSPRCSPPWLNRQEARRQPRLLLQAVRNGSRFLRLTRSRCRCLLFLRIPPRHRRVRAYRFPRYRK